VLGANSRSAIVQYQGFIGYPPTSVLSEYERTFLVSSYERALVGGPQAAQIMASSGQGTRGLLLAWRQEQMGYPPVTAAVPAPAPVAAPMAAARDGTGVRGFAEVSPMLVRPARLSTLLQGNVRSTQTRRCAVPPAASASGSFGAGQKTPASATARSAEGRT
jgi:hypothetical protein